MPLKECIICLETKIVFVDSPCGHKEFCLMCLNKITEQANENNDMSKCPFCRSIFPSCISTHLYLTCNEIELENNSNFLKNEIDFGEKQNIVQFIAQNGNLRMMKVLLKNEPKLAITCVNVGNALPHVIASMFGHKEFVRYVLNFIKNEFLSMKKNNIVPTVVELNGDKKNHMPMKITKFDEDDVTMNSSEIVEPQTNETLSENETSVVKNENNTKIDSFEPLGDHGARALNESIRTQEFEIAEMLLTEFEMDPNLFDGRKNNAFMVAVLTNQAHWLEKNKHYVNNIDVKNEEGMTLLHTSCLENNSEAIKFCINQNANVNLLDSDEYSPLHYIMNSGGEPSVLKNCQLLINAGANVNIGSQIGNGVPLMTHACSLDVKPEVIRYLIKQNANIHEANENDFDPLMSPLLEAVEHENIGNVRALLEHNANPNDNRFGDLPLHGAVLSENEELCRLLLSHNADPNLKNEEGYYPIEIVLQDHISMSNSGLSQEILNQLKTNEENRMEILQRTIDNQREMFLTGIRLSFTQIEFPISNDLQASILHLGAMFYQNASEHMLQRAQRMEEENNPDGEEEAAAEENAENNQVQEAEENGENMELD
jgi:ankyrin repeat protein